MPRPRKTVIEYRSYEIPTDFPLLLLEGDRWRISDVRSDNLHFHNCLEIGVCHSNSGVLIVEGAPIAFREGDITCLPRHIPHTTYSSPGEESLWTYLFFDPDEVLSRMLHDNRKPFESSVFSSGHVRYIMERENFPKIHNLTRLIIEELHDKRCNYRAAAEGLCLALCMELQRVQEGESDWALDPCRREKLSIGPALDFIRQNYMNELSIEEIADLCHLSTTHFRRAFHAIIGDSPLNYINKTRIERACTLLKTTDRSVLSVSETVGFSSISSFNSFFKRIVGMTPRQFRTGGDQKPEKTAILEYSGWV